MTRQTWCISFVTVGELTKWTVLRNWGPTKLASLADWRQHVVTLPYSEQVAVRWGELQARAERRGRPRPVNDAWIAASCLVRDLPLATLNIKDFSDFADHDGLRIVGVANADRRRHRAHPAYRQCPGKPRTVAVKHSTRVRELCTAVPARSPLLPALCVRCGRPMVARDTLAPEMGPRGRAPSPRQAPNQFGVNEWLAGPPRHGG